MAIFISYSHSDAKFVDVLAANLIKAKHNVWVDRWELNVGDSLTARIQDALTGADAILVVLSKASVQSEWCKRELTAGLVRELEERRTLVLPCVVDDCEIPLFLKDKLHADFGRDPDRAFAAVDKALAKFTNAAQGRVETPDFFTDWSLDWADPDEHGWCFRWTFVDHGPKVSYVVLSECMAYGDDEANRAWTAIVDTAEREPFVREVLRSAVNEFKHNPLKEPIQDSLPKYVAWKVTGPNGERFTFMCSYRRMGEDTGMDTVLHVDNNLRTALERMDRALRPAN